MKKLIPYILSYLIITAGVSVYAHFSRHARSVLYPPNSVTVITTLSHAELAAKLQQAGLSEAQHMMMMTERPAPMLSLIMRFLMFAVYFTAFTGLTLLFQRAFRTNVTSHDHAA
jgi:hypothetical protein